MDRTVSRSQRKRAALLMGQIMEGKKLQEYRLLLAQWVCAVSEMEGYDQFVEWSGDGPDWLRRLARETMEELGIGKTDD